MSQQTTIRKLAELVSTPVEKLLEQLAEAGMSFSNPDQVVTSSEKLKLLGFLKRAHGKSDTPVEEVTAPKKITLARRKVQELTVGGGRSKTTVNVEVRQKRTYVKAQDGQPEAHRRRELMSLQHAEQDIMRRRRFDQVDVTGCADAGRRCVEIVNARGLPFPLAELRGDECQLSTLGRGQCRQGIGIDVPRTIRCIGMRDRDDNAEAIFCRNRGQGPFRAMARQA